MFRESEIIKQQDIAEQAQAYYKSIGREDDVKKRSEARFKKGFFNAPFGAMSVSDLTTVLPAQLSPEQLTWGNKETVAQLYSQGKTESEIIELTKNRRAFVHTVIRRLQHPEPEPEPAPTPEIRHCMTCETDISNRPRQARFCDSCNQQRRYEVHERMRAKAALLKQPVSEPKPELKPKRELKPAPKPKKQVIVSLCEICGKQINSLQAKRYCGNPCRIKSLTLKGKEHHVTLSCRNCGKPFDVMLCMKDKRKICSRACVLAHQTNIKVNCIRCGKEFKRYRSEKNKYCGKSCYDLTRHETAIARKEQKRLAMLMLRIKKCPECGIEFTRTHFNQKYDKKECRARHVFKIRNTDPAFREKRKQYLKLWKAKLRNVSSY